MISHHSALAALILSVTLAACGGGGDEPAETPTQASCEPVPVVSIVLQGDSTNYGHTRDKETDPIYRVGLFPEFVLQQEMDRTFGIGAVKVTTKAESGTTSTYMLKQPGWNKGDIVLVNYGINDFLQSVPPATYRENLRTIAKSANVVFETPMPSYGHANYAPIMREVVAETGARMIDVAADIAALPDWSQYVGDGVHPNSDGYGLVNRTMVAPRVAAMVAKLKCQ